jgi:hypothetical protein
MKSWFAFTSADVSTALIRKLSLDLSNLTAFKGAAIC